MIIDVRKRPYSRYRPAYMEARKSFSTHPNKPENNPRLYVREFGRFIGATVIVEWVDNYFGHGHLRVTGLEFDSEEAYAWFLLRWS